MPPDRTDYVLMTLILCAAIVGSAGVMSIVIHKAAKLCAPTTQGTV